MTFQDYLNELAAEPEKRTARSKNVSAILVEEWSEPERVLVKRAFKSSVKKISQLKVLDPRFASSTNQSKGNKVEALLIDAFRGDAGLQFTLAKAPGSGYPDALGQISGLGEFFVELKATSNWTSTDTLRRVLMSSVIKVQRLLRRAQPPLAKHLILTAEYDSKGSIQGLRLHFLNPSSKVNVRLEAATSHKMLSDTAVESVAVRLHP